MPEFLSNLFQYRSDYIWCNNKMDDDFFLLFHLFLTKLPGIYILPFFTICFHEKLIKSLKRSHFCFSIAFFWQKKHIKKVVKIYSLTITKLSGKTKSYIAQLCFHEKRIKSFKISFFVYCVLYNMVVRKIRENLFLTKISGKSYLDHHMFSRKSLSCSFVVCFFFRENNVIGYKNLRIFFIKLIF